VNQLDCNDGKNVFFLSRVILDFLRVTVNYLASYIFPSRVIFDFLRFIA
jgi:hypothetical protein